MSQSKHKNRFRPETTVFRHSSKIHPALLNDVVNCYTKGRPVCKACYYRRKLTSPIKYQDGYMYCRECRKHCERVWLMPASSMCYNFGNFTEVPIPQSVGRRQASGKPFEICQKEDHFNCFNRSANSEIWFAHTIEELVIWTIEREYKCSFKEYIEKHYFPSKKVHWKYNNNNDDNEEEKEETEEDSIVQKEGRGRINYSSMSRSLSDLDLDEFQDLNYTGGIYDPEKIEIKFKSISDIPQQLLKDIAECYIKGQEVCKFCFFRRSEEVKKPLDSRGFSPACLRCKMYWQSIKIIPASSLCCNFNNMKNVPINIPVIKPSKIQVSHSYCSKSDHSKCFAEGYSQGFSTAHSVEELVIWLVERDSGVGYGNFGEYIKNNELVFTSGRRSTTPTKGGHYNKKKYDPEDHLFSCISDIPNELLFSVSQCYKQVFEICRICYFDSLTGSGYDNDPALTVRDGKTCDKGHLWRSLKVIPSSPLCNSYSVYIAVTPVPKHMMISKSAFKVCSMADHKSCFEKTRENNPWFPHTVEEMVIWTVERETGKSFQYYQEFISPNDYTPGSTPFKMTPTKIIKEETFNDCQDDASVSNSNETAPMYFDNLSSSSSSNNMMSGVNDDMIINNESLLGEGLTLDEASRFFPALVSNQVGGVPLINNNNNTIIPSINDPIINDPLPSLDHLLPASTLRNQPVYQPVTTIGTINQPVYQPVTTIGTINQPVYQPVTTIGTINQPVYQPMSTAATTLPVYQPMSSNLYQPATTTGTTNQPVYQPVSNNPVSSIQPVYQSMQSSLSHSLLGPSHQPLVHQSSNTLYQQPLSQPVSHQFTLKNNNNTTSILQEEEESDSNGGYYECYLCYREFDSPRDIAEHCMKEKHLELVKQDSVSTSLWIYYPPPPDQIPQEYKLCQKPLCPARLRCCKAHSDSELQEWYIRYRHRQQCSLYNTTPTSLVSMATINKTHDNYKGVDINIISSHHNTVIRSGTTVKWTIEIRGQGWQTLIGIASLLSSTPLNIVSIKGDTIYSIFPRSSEWITPSFKESILLGSIFIVVKATPTISGLNEYHVHLFLGSTEFLDISLKVLCQ